MTTTGKAKSPVDAGAKTKKAPKKTPAKKKAAPKKAAPKKAAVKKTPKKKLSVKAPPKTPPKKKPSPTTSDFHTVIDNVTALCEALSKLEIARKTSPGEGPYPPFGGSPIEGVCAAVRDSLLMQLYALDELTEEFLPTRTPLEKITEKIEENSAKDIAAAVDDAAPASGAGIPTGMPVGGMVPASLRATPLPLPGMTTS